MHINHSVHSPSVAPLGNLSEDLSADLSKSLTGPKLLLKRSLTAFLCALAAAATIAPNAALAGSRPVVPPDSSNAVGETFAPTRPRAEGETLTTQIGYNVLSILQTIRARQSVDSVTDKVLFIPAAKVDIIAAALSSERTGRDIEQLERQIFDETSGKIQVDLSALGTSEGDVKTATDSINTFFKALTAEQLAVAVESPTLMTIWRLLLAANDVLDGYVITFPGGGTTGVFTIRLL